MDPDRKPLNMFLHSTRRQRTLAREVALSGVGFVSGEPVSVTLKPAPGHTGVVFVRADLPGRPRVPATAGAVADTRRRTTLGRGRATVTLAEHVLAALAGLRVDNCVVELCGPEPPGLDGSSLGFARAVCRAGAVLQADCRPRYAPAGPIAVRRGGATLAIHPHDRDDLLISYILDYGAGSSIAPQVVTASAVPASFMFDLAACRTFLLEGEARQLQAAGVGRHLTPRELLVFGPGGPLENAARFADEPGRHKILDIIGDLSLCGADLVGHVVAYRSGHPLNVELAGRLAAGVSAARPAARAA